MRHSIIFGGIDSADFGIYIGGEGTFNAPERDVEMISIPGRDGAFALDKGRFENIEVKYTVINQEPDLATFSANLEGFRNAICSQRGYQRLEDTFHPDEYRMAVFADKFEAKPIEYNTASKFDIVFNCKPQRFLTSGETAITVNSGDTLTNPTLLESSPLLEAEGYGKIVFDNGYEIDLVNGMLGNIQLLEGGQKTLTGNATTVSGSATFDRSLVEVGDTITISGKQYSSSPNASVSVRALFSDSKRAWINNETHTNVNVISSYSQLEGDTNLKQAIGFSAVPTTFTVGTAGTFTASTQYSYTEHLYNSQTTGTATFKVSATISYDGNDTITTTMTRTLVADTLNNYSYNSSEASRYIRFEATADSSVSIMGQPTYIDCDIGEVYKVEGDTIVSLNRYVDLGSKLPTLAVGGTEITYDNTITDLKVVPRWWKV